MKHFQEVSKLDIQVMKIRIGDFSGINTDLRIDPNSIPYTDLKTQMYKTDTVRHACGSHHVGSRNKSPCVWSTEINRFSYLVLRLIRPMQ